MLKNMDLDKTVNKEEYKAKMIELGLRLGELQRKAKVAQIPVMLVFEGWDAAGKGTLINKVLQSLDPRGYNIYPTKVPTENEVLHPFLWRFWTKTPPKGRIVFFDRSWYRRVTIDRLDSNLDEVKIKNSFEDIINFEKQMVDSGCVIIKFFLHISQKEQMKRFLKLQNDPATQWRVTKEDFHSHHHYNEYIKIYEDMIEQTNVPNSPWVVVEANNKRYASIKIFSSIIKTLENALEQTLIIQTESKETKELLNSENYQEAVSHSSSIYVKNPLSIVTLDNVDLSLKFEDETQYRKKLKYCQDRLRELEHEIYKKRISVVVLYEGWDAAGKGGNIRRLVENLDPRGYEVLPVAAPNDEENAHHYLWRFWRNMPKDGHIAIFDRSWYGRVLVERVEGYCSVEEWTRAYREINEMETHLVKHGVILTKFFLHIDKEEQLRRFNDRENIIQKNWKITPDDWRNRDKWDSYKEAVDDMLIKTSTNHTPWTIIESNDKYYGRIKVYENIIKVMEEKLQL